MVAHGQQGQFYFWVYSPRKLNSRLTEISSSSAFHYTNGHLSCFWTMAYNSHHVSRTYKDLGTSTVFWLRGRFWWLKYWSSSRTEFLSITVKLKSKLQSLAGVSEFPGICNFWVSQWNGNWKAKLPHVQPVQFPRDECWKWWQFTFLPMFPKCYRHSWRGKKKVRKSVNGHSEACVLSKAEVKIATDIFLVSDLNSKHHTLPLYVSCNLSLQKDGKNVLNKNN